eukprot:TRINITY_DN2003_c0_g1_i1.p1 TRINITY_DN2003_c0_g1~~TRINITY_DN2003_c0_g1_i1.p1  ORF type:complete len:172 (-),score=28.28 TRINITY_DN2003_c0_g1_i1:59-574(-)
MTSTQKLARTFKILGKATNLTVKLIEENLDQWEVTYHYPNDRCVILKFEFHLKEPLPPKITVVFPSEISYVCFEELGTVKWNDSDIETLVYSLQQEYSHRSGDLKVNRKLTETEANNQWNYVKNAHTDWKMVDISEISTQITETERLQLRTEAKNYLNTLINEEQQTQVQC